MSFITTQVREEAREAMAAAREEGNAAAQEAEEAAARAREEAGRANSAASASASSAEQWKQRLVPHCSVCIRVFYVPPFNNPTCNVVHYNSKNLPELRCRDGRLFADSRREVTRCESNFFVVSGLAASHNLQRRRPMIRRQYKRASCLAQV